MTTTVYPTRINVWMAIYAHVTYPRLQWRSHSSIFYPPVWLSPSSRLFHHRQKAKLNKSQPRAVGIGMMALVLLPCWYSRSFFTHVYHRYFKLYTIIGTTYGWVYLLIPTAPRPYIYVFLPSRAWVHTQTRCLWMYSHNKYVSRLLKRSLCIIRRSPTYANPCHYVTLLGQSVRSTSPVDKRWGQYCTPTLVLLFVSVSVLVYSLHSYSLAFPCSTHSTHQRI